MILLLLLGTGHGAGVPAACTGCDDWCTTDCPATCTGKVTLTLTLIFGPTLKNIYTSTKTTTFFLPTPQMQSNTLPIFTGEPTFVRSAPHGKRYLAGSATLDPQIVLLHVYGTAFEMGEAQGQWAQLFPTHVCQEHLEHTGRIATTLPPPLPYTRETTL